MIKKKSIRGGSRKNAGRKKKYNEATTVVSFRVPKSKKTEVVNIVNEYLGNAH